MLTEKYKGFTIKVEQDSHAESPRWDGDMRTKMVCFHNRYDLGDTHKFKTIKGVVQHIIRTKAINLPLYLYDHGGITMNTTGFNCQFDAMLVGYIYMPKKEILKEFKVKEITEKIRKEVKGILLSEVETYDCFLRNEVYGYIIEKNGAELDSCWGYYGHAEYCMEQAKEQAEHLIPNSIKYMKELNGQQI
jgi:hypothetical protein